MHHKAGVNTMRGEDALMNNPNKSRNGKLKINMYIIQ